MIKRDIIFSLFSALATVLLVFYVSCASQDAVEDGRGFEPDDELSLTEDGEEEWDEEDELLAEEEGDEDEEFEEEDEENFAAEEEDEDGEALTVSEVEESEEDEEITALEEEDGEEDEEIAALEEEDGEEEWEDGEEDDIEELEKELLALEDSPTQSVSAPAAAPVQSQDDFADDFPESTNEIQAEPLEDTAIIAENSVIDVPEVPSIVYRAPYRKSITPQIPKLAITRGSTSLNRYYIVRPSDNAEGITALLFGDESRVDDLVRWNGGRRSWKAGTILYYQSPVEPNDNQMASFYEAREIDPDYYTVRAGDWLSSIATRTYGSSKSWKEIAIVNGLASPDALSRGNKLKLYPKNLSPYSASRLFVEREQKEPNQPPVVQKPPPLTPPNTMAQNEPNQPPPLQTPPPTNAGVQQEALPPIETPPAEPPKAQAPPPTPVKKAPSISKLIEQNMFFLAIGGVILLLFLSLVVVNKRKKAARDEFQEDDFASRAKSRAKK